MSSSDPHQDAAELPLEQLQEQNPEHSAAESVAPEDSTPGPDSASGPDSAPGESPKSWGTIFMGPGPMGEVALSDVAGPQASGGWDAATEARYLERVREKAANMAREVLEKAQAEAESIRNQAYEQGYADGLAQAQAELEEFRATMGDSAAAVLQAIEAQSPPVLAQWKDDLVALLRLAVERMAAVVLSEERAAVLESLYLDAFKHLESHRKLTIRVNPEDEAAVADIIQSAKERTPGLEQWTVKADPSLEAGGLRIESANSLADNSLTARRAAVEHVLADLQIP